MTSLKFIGTMLLLGPATILFSMLSQSAFASAIAAQTLLHQIVNLLCGFIAAATTAKLLWELAVFTHFQDADWTPMKRTAILLSAQLKRATIARFFFGLLGGVVLPVVGLTGMANAGTAAGILAFSLFGELLERYLFFTAVVPPKMPGAIAS